MLNIKELSKALKQVAEEKGLDPDKVLDVIESSIAAAYKKEYGERGEVVKCKMDQKTGELNFWQIKTVVDDTTVRFVEEEEEVSVAESAAVEKKTEPRKRKRWSKRMMSRSFHGSILIDTSRLMKRRRSKKMLSWERR